MRINDAGLELIKSFEGCRLVAYDDLQPNKTITDISQVKGTLTIGYGHTAGVTVGMAINQVQANNMLKTDMKKYEKYVTDHVKIPLNENQFSALVSFCYNAGVGNLKKLVKNRTAEQIADAMISYNKAKDKTGKYTVLAGLVRRREAERRLFLSGGSVVSAEEETYNMKKIKKGSKGTAVKIWQIIVGVEADGSFGPATETATKNWQRKNGLSPDGIVGAKSWRAGLESA